MDKYERARPVLRWAGGKRRLVNHLVELLPARWNTYVEPMAGGAAFFFRLAPQQALLADINADLINFYRVLRNDTSALVRRLASLHASKSIYYRMRKRKPRSRLGRAVRFAYLNRLCWNGLHRVNRKGGFNVPIGDRLPKKLWDLEELHRAAELLRNARLVSADFEKTLQNVRRGDFVFIDPPYPLGARDGFGFNRYASDFFLLDDHKRLGRLTENLDKGGVSLMILLSPKPEILSCYPSSFRRTEFRSRSLISGTPLSRNSISEIALTNYRARS